MQVIKNINSVFSSASENDVDVFKKTSDGFGKTALNMKIIRFFGVGNHRNDELPYSFSIDRRNTA